MLFGLLYKISTKSVKNNPAVTSVVVQLKSVSTGHTYTIKSESAKKIAIGASVIFRT